MQVVDTQWIEMAILGGTILGGGGGGNPDWGRRLGKLAVEVGQPAIVRVETLPSEGLILTVSAVGAPSTNQNSNPVNYVKATNLVLENFGEKIAALMPNEIGGFAVVNGLLQSAILGIPVVDAACNGRAHPTGLMGAIGLSRNVESVIHEAAVGGLREQGSYIEMYAKGCLPIVSRLVRKASQEVGGIIAVARTPLPVSYIREHAAIGALGRAVEVGNAHLKGKTAEERVHSVTEVLNGRVIAWDTIKRVELELKEGFDVGKVIVGKHELTFWNEYITLGKGTERVATFPDLIMTMKADTGEPITSAEIRQGQDVAVIMVPKENLILGAGMKDPALFHIVERAIGKPILKYVFDEEG